MSEYRIDKWGDEFVVLACGKPLLRFVSRLDAEVAIAEVARHALRPVLHRPVEAAA